MTTGLKKQIVGIDSLFAPLYSILFSFARLRRIKTVHTKVSVVIKLMGMGSILKLSKTCDDLSIDKTLILLITREEHREVCVLSGFTNCVFISFRISRFLFDCGRAVMKARKMNPMLIIDFERCSNMVGAFRTAIAILSASKTISFSDNEQDRIFRKDTVFGRSRLTHEKMFTEGLHELGKSKRQSGQVTVEVNPIKVIVNVNVSDYLLIRRYKGENFLATIKLINERLPGLEFYFTGVRHEFDYVESIVTQLKSHQLNVHNCAGKWSFIDLARNMSDSQLVLTADSGPLHLATLLQIPTVALWGPTQPAQFGYDQHPTIRNLSEQVPCSPCFHSPKSRTALTCNGKILCMKIKPEQIANSVLEILNQKCSRRTLHLTIELQHALATTNA